MSNSNKGHKGVGHRKRLRNKFLKSGFSGFHDYEIVELLLTLNTPRKDCKPMAKEAIKKFGGIRGVLDASKEDLQEIEGIGSKNLFGLKLFREVNKWYEREKIEKGHLINSAEDIASYLKRLIGNKDKEHFVVFCLNKKNRVIDHEISSVGILDSSLVHPREVFNLAVKCSAAGVIVAHNHPSGDITPSKEDKNTTNMLQKAGKALGINLIDHIIVTKDNYKSIMK